MYEGGSGSTPGATVVATVKWYHPVKGFGFLAPADGSRDLFCHVSEVSSAGLPTLPEGATVTCEVEQGPRGPQVLRIHAVDAPPASTGPAGSGGPLRGQHGHELGEQGPSSGRRLVANVKWFVPSKGFGFLVPDDGGPDVFYHASVVRDAGYDTLSQGATVTCEVTEGQRGPAVSSIVVVDASTAMAEPVGRDEPYRDQRERRWGRAEPAGPVEERSGLVKFYDSAKGYGFVVPDDGGPDVFVPGVVLNRAGLGVLETDQRVSVMVEQGTRSPGEGYRDHLSQNSGARRHVPHAGKGSWNAGTVPVERRGKARGLRRFRCKEAGGRLARSRARRCRGCTIRSAGCPLASCLPRARRSRRPPRAARLRRARRIAGATASWRRSSRRRTGLPGSSRRTRSSSSRAARGSGSSSASRAGKAKKRGLSREQVPVLVAADRGGETLSHTLPALNADNVKQMLELVLAPDALLVSDANRYYPPVAAALDIRGI